MTIINRKLIIQNETQYDLCTGCGKNTKHNVYRETDEDGNTTVEYFCTECGCAHIRNY